MQKKYAVEASNSFIRELESAPPDVAGEVAGRLKVLEFAPLPAGTGLVKKLGGLYCLKVEGWRVLYRISGDTVAVLLLVSRKALGGELEEMGLFDHLSRGGGGI